MGGEPVAGVARRHRPARRRRGRSSRRVLYGDYLRTARSRGSRRRCGRWPGRSPRPAGPVLGICNGFQILCEAGLLPGALIRNRACRSSAAGSTCGWRGVGPRPARSAAAATCSRSRSSTARASSWRRRDELDRLERDGPGRAALLLAGRRGERRLQPERRRRGTSPASGTTRATSLGLMPHPEHAVDPDLGPTGGQPILGWLLSAARAIACRA